MAVAIISDLHANIEALARVLDDIRTQGVERIYCLGDLVGYGPDPEEVVDRAMDWPVVLMGNHDEAVLRGAYGFNPVARAAVLWTQKRLMPGFLSGPRRRRRWSFLSNGLKQIHEEDTALFVHGSPRDPTMEYILRSDCFTCFGEVPDKIRDIFSRVKRLLFVGHTHEPGVITEEAKFIAPKDVDYEYRFEPGRKYIVNVGSVGQPRDGDPRACYAIWDGDLVRWRRVEYDFRKTMEKIYAIPELDRRSADRLALGK